MSKRGNVPPVNVAGMQLAIFEVIWRSYPWIERIWLKTAPRTVITCVQTASEPAPEAWDSFCWLMNELLDIAFEGQAVQQQLVRQREPPGDGEYVELMSGEIFRKIGLERPDPAQETDGEPSEWQRSYDAILPVVQKFGRDNAFGEEEFWLVDDDWGGQMHKLYIFDISALTRELVDALMAVLAEKFPAWKIMLALDLQRAGEGDVPPEGLMISGRYVEEYWDSRMLRSRFAERFVWR